MKSERLSFVWVDGTLAIRCFAVLIRSDAPLETPSAYFKSKTWGLESEISSPEAEIPAMRPATCDHLGAALAADLIRSSKLSLSEEAALAALDQKLEISITWGLHC